MLANAGEIFNRAVGKQAFENARFAQSVFEQAYARMAARAASDGTVTIDEVVEIAPEDLEWSDAAFEPGRRRIGFAGRVGITADGDASG